MCPSGSVFCVEQVILSSRSSCFNGCSKEQFILHQYGDNELIRTGNVENVVRARIEEADCAA